MYYQHFGLSQAPFGITPDTQLFYSGGRRGDVLDALVYAITHGEGIVKVVGEVGSGKTMLCRMLEARLPAAVDGVYLSNPRIDPADVVYAVAQELRLPIAADASRLQVQNALHEFLLERHAAGRRVVVFVEEAQGAPLDTLEEIRLLTNLETEREKLLQIVLFGQPELDRHLADARIRQLRERITHSFHLEPLPPPVTMEYVRHRLRAVGHRDGDLFSAAALQLLARVSKGLMRRVNILADKALLAAYAAGSTTVHARHVRAAIRDSEFAARRRLWWPWSVGAIAFAGAVLAALSLRVGGVAQTHATTEIAPAENLPREAALAGPPSAAAGLAERLERSRVWLRQAGDKRFTIQVFQANADAIKDLERFLQTQEIRAYPDQVFVYQARRDGQTVHGVVLGDYASNAEARAVLDTLPQTLQRYRPYVRSTRTIRAATEDNGST